VYQYYVTEVRKTQAGEFEHENYWAFDENAEKARLKGEAKFHEILSRAAISTYAEHGAILFSSKCYPLMHDVYEHKQEE